MAKGLVDPVSGKTYVYKGFTPLRSVSDSCQGESHANCLSSPQLLIKQFDFEFTKKNCCLCGCHFE